MEGHVATDLFPGLTGQLMAYTYRLQDETVAAAVKASEFLHERVVAKARLDPLWEPLADHIEVWSQDGRLIVGVRDREFTSEAFAIEYGDEVRPPTPLFRTLTEDMREASEIMGEHMTTKFGRSIEGMT